MVSRSKLTRDENHKYAVDKLVSKLEIKFTMPQEMIVKQEDEAEVAADANGNACMFFIAKGACTVKVRVRHILQVQSDGETDNSSVEVRKLFEGDHFGEIALIYGC